MFSHAWRVLTSDPKIMDIVRHCHIDFWETPRQRQWVAKLEDRFLKKERQIIDIQIQEFLQKGIISRSIFQEEQIISQYFCVLSPMVHIV